MSSHEIQFCSGNVWCSCSPTTMLATGPSNGIYSLSGLAAIAHEHIERAEQAYSAEPAWCQIPGHKHRTSHH